MFLKRRRVGVSYELCPAERIGLWAQRNLLVLLGGVGCVVGWFVLVILATKMLNSINSQYDHPPMDDGSPTGVAIKLIGGLVIFVLVVARQSK